MDNDIDNDKPFTGVCGASRDVDYVHDAHGKLKERHNTKSP